MAKTCSICAHPHRAAIDRQLIANVPMLTLAKEFGVGRMAIHRHRINCAALPPASSKEALADRREPTRAAVALASLPSREELGARYETLGERIDAIIQEAKDAGSLAIAVQGLNSLRQNWDSLSKLAGNAGGAPTVNVGVQINVTPADIASALAERLASLPIGSRAGSVGGVEGRKNL